jgi:hypothetical protein
MDDVIEQVYGFAKDTTGYHYVSWCIRKKVILHPWKWLKRHEPMGVSCSTLGHLARASEILAHYHHWKFI